MIKKYLFVFCLFLFVQCTAQSVIQTIVPDRAVAVGEAFRVQYVVADVVASHHFTAPLFPGFRVVRGPDLYPAAGSDNYVFTLVPVQTGRLLQESATGLFVMVPV